MDSKRNRRSLLRDRRRQRVDRRAGFTKRLAFELLEARRLLATVNWTGGGDDGLWSDPNNWSPNGVPGVNDDVMISGSDTIVASGSIDVGSITTSQNNTLELEDGFDAVEGPNPSNIAGPLILDDVGLEATGTGVTFTANGTTTSNGAGLEAESGATLSLPNLTTYQVNSVAQNIQSIFAVGSGSKVELDGLTALSGITVSDDFEAVSGGELDMPVLQSTNGNLQLEADGSGSLLSVPMLASITGTNNKVTQTDGAMLSAADLTTLQGAEITVDDATAGFTGVTNIDGSSLTIDGGAQVTLSGVQSYSSNGSASFELSQTSTLSLPNLATMTTSSGMTLSVLTGSQLSLAALGGTPGGALTIEADDTNSVINLPLVQGLASGSAISQLSGGSVNLPDLTSAPGTTITIAGGTPNFANLAVIDGSTINIDDGSMLTLTAVTSANTNSANVVLSASGSDSLLSLPNLSSITGTNVLEITAESGGQTTLAALAGTPGAALSITANDGEVDLPELTALPAGNSLIQSNGGTLTLTDLTSIAGASLTVSDATATFAANLLNINGASITVENGSTLTLASATSVDSGSTGALFEATGASSLLSFPQLTTVTGAKGLSIEASAGGTVNLGTITTFNAGDLQINALGMNSAIDLPLLQSISGTKNSLSQSSTAAFSAPDLTSANNVGITVNAATPTFTGLTNIDGSGLEIDGGAQLTLSGVTSYANAGSTQTFETSGSSSVLKLPNLASFTGPGGLVISAQSGGDTELPALAGTPTSTLSLSVGDPQSTVSVPLLTGVIGGSITQAFDGALNVPDLTSVVDGSITVTGAVATFAADLTNVNGSSVEVSGGSSLVLPGITSINSGSSVTELDASGAGSVLELPHLTSITGTSLFNISADTSGNTKLPALVSIASSTVEFIAQTDGVIEIGALNSLSTTSDTWIQSSGGQIIASSLQSLNNAAITFDNALPELPVLTNIDNSSLEIEGGATVNLPGITSYSNSNGAQSFDANGLGSVLNLPNLVSTSSPTALSIFAENHGLVQMASLESSSGDPLYLNATEPGIVNLPALLSLPANSRINETGPNVLLASLQTYTNVEVSTDSATTFTIGSNQTFADSSFGGAAIDGGPIVDDGVLSLVGSTVVLPEAMSIDGSGTISLDPESTLRIGGNLLGTTQNADGFSPQGTVILDSNTGTSHPPQLLEAMSADLGAVQAAFQDNFAYGTLSLDSNTYVQLVDESHNSSASQPEAVYVNELIVPAGATLDLNDLHLYVRGAQIAGTILNGTVTQVPSSGPITLNTTVTGTISPAGQVDDWTFFARAGQDITVQLDPGTFSGPPSPVLGFGQVTLEDAHNNVLATGTSSFDQIVSLSGVTIPANGTYTIAVQAPSAESSETGNYLLSGYNVTPNVNTLQLGEQENGTLASSLSIDQWTFSATAGQQVQFDLLANAFGGVAFDLTGPGNYSAFADSQTSTGPITLPATGTYTLTAQSFAGGHGSYAFELIPTTVTSLALNGSDQGTLAGTGGVYLYEVNVPVTQTLTINLTDSTSSDVNELYASLGSPPTRADFDYEFSNPGSANQQILIPSAAPGNWYILVYSAFAPAPSSFTISATGAQVRLTSEVPSSSAAGSTAVLKLTGSGFNGNASVELIGAGNTTYQAASVSLDTFTQLTATLDLTGVPQGTYAVEVNEPGGLSDELPGAFTVTAAGAAHFVSQLILPSSLGRHAPAIIYVEYSNTGNVAMPAPLLTLSSSVADDVAVMTLDPNLVYNGFFTSATLPTGYTNVIQILASGTQVPGMLEPGESITVPVYYAGMEQPFNLAETQFFMNLQVADASNTTPLNDSSLEVSTKPPSLSTAAWNAIFPAFAAEAGGTTGGYVQLLDNEANYLGQLGEDVTDVGQLWQFIILQANNDLLPISELDFNTDLALPMQGTLSLDFSQFFLPTLSARNTLGPLGYGWADDWQYSLAVASDGTVTVTMPGGAQRIFQPASNGTEFFDEPGDYGILRAGTAGTYTLQESNGQVEAFNAHGTLNYIEDTQGNRITAGYTTGDLTSLTSSAGGSLSIAYNQAGLISSVASADGRTVTYSYDASDQLTTVESYDGEITTYSYDTSGNAVTAHALTAIAYPDGTHLFYSYNAEGLLTGTSQDGGADPLTFAYNFGEVTVTDAAGDATQYFYNESGLLVKSVDPLGNANFATYDSNFNITGVTGPTGLTESLKYDANGNVIADTNPLGQTTTYTYTGSDNLLASYTNAQGATTKYQYDASGNLTSTLYADDTVSSATYDALGDPLTIVNQNGQVTSETYNAVGQITGETLADGTTYTFTYDADGNLATATSAAGTITLSYDTGDRLTEVQYPNGQYLQYTYDGGGRRIKMVDQAGDVTNYLYNAVGQLAGLTDGNNNSIVTYSYNNVGELIEAADGVSGGPYTTYQYDAAGDVTSVVNYAGNGSVNSSFQYTYNVLGEMATMITLDGTWTYSYDTTDQLVHAVFASTNNSIPSQDLTYEYNAAGDRTETIVNGVTTNYTTNSVNEVTSTSDGTTYTYDADGNLISETNASGTTTTYTYDSLDRLISVTSPTDSFMYEYDALGNLAATIHNGQMTQNLVDPNGLDGLSSVVAQYDGDSNLIAGYTYGLGLVSQFTASATNYYQFDAQGSTADLTNSAGTIENSYSYLPFGGTLTASGSAYNPFTFVGQFGVSTNSSGLFNMQARDYDPVVGQFLSNDPTGLAGGDTNLRRYAANSPTNLVDPSGLESASDLFSAVRGGYDAQHQQNISGLRQAQIDNDAITKRDRLESYKPDGETVTDLVMAGTRASGNFSVTGAEFFQWNWAAITADAERAEREYDAYIQEKGKQNQALRDQNPLPPGGSSAGSGTTAAAKAFDPNALIGPDGFGSENFVAAGTLLPYEIDFENDPSATAPAQEVTISDPLDPSLDPSTFQLREIAFGSFVLTVPAANAQSYQTTVVMTYNNETFDVVITAGINLATDTVYATFASINPNTDLPPDVLTGFLPPEDGTGRGQGRIDFTIMPKAGLPTGTQITNVATVVFDEQNSIATDQVDDDDPSQGIDTSKQALVTIDSGAPTSSVAALPSTETSGSFLVSWSGSDDAGGSGIATYNVYVSDNSGPYTPFETNTTLTSATFTGAVGDSYSFYSVATDNVGNVQPTPTAAQAMTTIQLASIPTQLVIATEPPQTVTAAAGFGLTVDVDDSQNNLATTYSGTVTVAIASNPAGGTLGGTFTASVNNGMAVFSGLTLNLVGSGYTLQVTSGTLTSATSSAISVTAGAATQLLITAEPPATVTAGAGFSFTVTAKDAEGNIATGFTGTETVALAANPGGSTLGGTLIVSANSGIATFSGLSLNKVGSGYTLAVSSGTLASATSSAITVVPGAATQLLITTEPPATVTAGAGFGLTVTAKDAEGNIATGFTGSETVALAANPGSSTLGGTLIVSANSGIASFSGLTLNKVGSGYTLAVSGGTLTSATSSAISVVPGAATQLLITTQPPATVTAGAGFSFTVTAKDTEGNIATGFTGSETVAIANNPGGSSLGGTLTVSAANGVASFSGLNLNKVGSGYTLSVTSGTLTSATSSAISVVPGAATQLLITSEPPATVTAGAGFGLTVTAKDAEGNIATGFTGSETVALAANPGGSTLDGTLIVSANSGVASFSGLTLNKVGSGYTLAVSSGTLTAATSSAMTVVPGAATQLLITSEPPATVTAGAGFGLTVTAKDAEGNIATGFTGSETVALAANPGSSTLGGTLIVSANSGIASFSGLTLNKVGSGYTLAVSGGTLTSATSSAISVVPGAATHLLITTQPPATVTAGAGFSFTVTAKDTEGNIATGFTGSETVAIANNPGGSSLGGTLTVSAANGVASFSGLNLNKVGSGYTLSVISGTLASATSSAISVVPGAATQLLITTQPPATVTAGASFSSTVTAKDAEGNIATGFSGSETVALAANPGSSSLGGTLIISATSGVASFSGLTLNKVGSGYTLAVSSGTLTAATSSSISVTAGAATQFVFNAPATVTAGVAFNLTVIAEDKYNNVATAYAAAVSLTSSDHTATFTPSHSTLTNGQGTFAATLSTAGSQTIQASDGTITNSFTTTVVAATNTSILLLDSKGAGALSLSGNAIINETGAVVVDSNSATAVEVSGNAQVTASSIRVVGGVQKSGNAKLNPTPTTGSTAVADPFASLSAPAAGTSRGSESISGSTSLTINPGIYSQIVVAGNASLTLSAGVYEIAGGGFNISGNAKVTGTGVLIYNAGSAFPKTGGSFGAINLSGNAIVNLTAATSGAYTGITFFQSRDNTTALQLSGNAMLGSGTVYAPGALLTLSGNSNLSGLLIVDDLALSGNADPSPTLPAPSADFSNAGHAQAPMSTIAALPLQPGMIAGLSNVATGSNASDRGILVSAASGSLSPPMVSYASEWSPAIAIRSGTEPFAGRTSATARPDLPGARDRVFDLGTSSDEFEPWWSADDSLAPRSIAPWSPVRRTVVDRADNAAPSLGQGADQAAAIEAAIVAWEESGSEKGELEEPVGPESESTELSWTWTVALALLGWCHVRSTPEKRKDRQPSVLDR